MHTFRRRIALFAIAVPVALVAAGCGGDSNRTESYSALISKANAICTTVGTQVKAAQAAKDWDKISTASDDAMKKLKALTPPDKLKAAYADYLTKQQATVDATKPVVAALNANDQAAAQNAAEAGNALGKVSDAAALKVGLAVCGKPS